MNVRRRVLPVGWYPASEDECVREIEGFLAERKTRPAGLEVVRGGIVPHAGWLYSGRLATWVMAMAKAEDPQVVILFGGHMGPGAPRLVMEDAWETPLGDVTLARDLAESLARETGWRPEPRDSADNTIEVQLPIIKYLFPQARVLAARAPHSPEAMELGRMAVEACLRKGLTCVAFGSTDLTHYGPNYGFMPKGLGEEAERWVKEVNDRRFTQAAIEMEPERVLRVAASEESACSAGAAAAAISACRRLGGSKGWLVGTYTSNDVLPGGASFVGYAGVVF